MCLKQLTFTKTTAMSFKLKNLFFVIALAISTGVVYGAHDNDMGKKKANQWQLKMKNKETKL